MCIIIDNGSGMCKAGLSNEDNPRFVFPELVGRPRRGHRLEKPTFCGDECEQFLGQLALSYALENGIIENFEDMELLWDHAFELLKANPSMHPVLLTEPPYNPKAHREKVVEIMFETFGVPTLNISVQGVLALLGQGRVSGLVLDSGEGTTHTIPVYEGFGIPHCINRLDLAGRDLNTLLGKLLAQENICLTTTSEQYHVRMMKEKHCYVALDPSNEQPQTVVYNMPDGQAIPLSDERWKCPEALFSPNAIVGLETSGVAEIVWNSISRCEIDIRRTLLSSIVLSGGSTMFPGFPERLRNEIKNYAPTATQANIKVVSSTNRQNAVWSGAQVFASLRSMQEDMWMTTYDFDEYGKSFIHDKITVRF